MNLMFHQKRAARDLKLGQVFGAGCWFGSTLTLLPAFHILSPVSPQEKMGHEGLCSWMVGPPVIKDAARL